MQIIPANALDALREMKDESVDCVVTSPPYWSLRKYSGEQEMVWGGDPDCDHQWSTVYSGTDVGRDDAYYGGIVYGELSKKKRKKRESSNVCVCGAWRGALSLEPTLEQYINHLEMIFTEVKRVMKKTGTCFVDIGDTYAGNGICGGGSPVGERKYRQQDKAAQSETKGRATRSRIKLKSLCQIPERFSLMMTDRLGFIKRNTLIWWKPNCMPSSTSDRFTVDFEPVYFFTKSPRYWFEQQFEPAKDPQDDVRRVTQNYRYQKKIANDPRIDRSFQFKRIEEYATPQGRNMRCVWRIPTQPSSLPHYAMFPEKLVEPIIRAGCPKEICRKCGKAREAIIKTDYIVHPRPGHGQKYTSEDGQKANNWATKRFPKASSLHNNVGYTDCGCGVGWDAGTVLDPFCGTGTVGVVAKRLGRNFIGIDTSQEYCDIAEKRIAQTVEQKEMEP